MRRLSALLFALLLAAAPLHAQNLPDLGDVASSDLSPLEERRIGEQIMREIRWGDPAYLDDVEVEDYVAAIGRRLVAASPEPDRDFEFFVIRDPSINAFALPGGFIGVHSGLLLTAETESEFASVLGHEVAHVTQRHIAQLFGKQNESMMMVLGSILIGALAAQSNPELAQAAIAAGQAGAIQAQLGYSRGFEHEADRIGLQLLERAGFDPRGMPGFFTRLQRATRVYESNAPGYLRTHPLTQDRFTDMENRVAQMRYRQVLDSPAFLYVRAKLKAGQGLAPDAVREFEAKLADQADDYSRYGLARALLRAGKLDEADRVVAAMGEAARRSSFVGLLVAELQLARRQPTEAIATLKPVLDRNPDSRALRLALIDAEFSAGNAAKSSELARNAIARSRADPRLWQFLARAEERLGRRSAYHRAQAEVYALRGSLPAAIEQLELARRAGDGDFYELSAVDARLRELKADDAARRAEKR